MATTYTMEARVLKRYAAKAQRIGLSYLGGGTMQWAEVPPTRIATLRKFTKRDTSHLRWYRGDELQFLYSEWEVPVMESSRHMTVTLPLGFLLGDLPKLKKEVIRDGRRGPA